MKTDIVQLMLADETVTSLRVFAYGSLLWKPCFHYHQQVVGFIQGHKRRFYQGNTNLRGTKCRPGRVAILVPDEKEVAWGVAYEIRGRQHVKHALEHLFVRENSNGGYHSLLTPFYPRPHPHPATSDGESDSEKEDDVIPMTSEPFHLATTSDGDSDSDSEKEDDVTPMTSEPFPVLLFTATAASDQYLGPADVSIMARQVVSAHGDAGPNTEYVLRTAEYVRHHIPEDKDRHLFELERAIRALMAPVHRKKSSSEGEDQHQDLKQMPQQQLLEQRQYH